MRALPVGFVLLLVSCGENATEIAKRESCERVAASWTLDPLGTTVAPVAHPALHEVATSSAAKLALAVYHFNVQYVAGGLIGFPDGEIVEQYNLDEVAVEDRIVRQGLEPVLDLYLAHPDFRADIELQAYMLEVIALRHKDVLDKMRELALRGQIDFDSFHYSDQLFVAYPRRDLVTGIDLTTEVFARTGVPLGLSIFTQEGQFATGQIPIAAEHGYQVSILPKNLFSYQFGETADQSVLYSLPGTDDHAVILGGRSWRGLDAQNHTVELLWTFMNDGEVAFSKGGLNPYFGLDYIVDQGSLDAHVAGLENLAAAGYEHVTVAEAVRALKRRGVTFPPLPPVLDGTWQPDDTNNLFRWMGGGGLFRSFESDSNVLSSIWSARTAAERLELESAMLPNAAHGVRATWREALLAEVSDSTGWNPFKNEIAYSRAHADAARALAADVRTCEGLAPDTAASRTLACDVSSMTLDALGIEVISPARMVTTKVESCTSSFGPLLRVTVEVPKLAEMEMLFDADDMQSKERELEVRFRQDARTFGVATAFTDGVQMIALDDYQFESIGIALPIGLIGLSGSRWLIQDLASARVAALISRTGADAGWVRFMDYTVSRAEGSSRRYYLADGLDAATARALAETINR